MVGGIYFHSIMFSKRDITTLKKSPYNGLGKTGSHGCICLLYTSEIMALGGGKGSSLGTGGMATKLIAAQRATEAGVDMVIADGDKPALLYDIMEGKQVGTYFVGRSK